MRVEENIVEWRDAGVHVRVWFSRDQVSAFADASTLHNACRGFIFFRQGENPDPYAAAHKLCETLGARVNAIQVHYSGFYGVVIYPDWP